MNITKKMVAVALLALAFAGCHRESTDFGGDGNGTNGSDGKLGYITFAQSGIVVAWGGENVNAPTGSEDFPKLESARTRAEVDVENFKVDLIKYLDGQATIVATKTLAEWRAGGPCGVPFTQGGKECYYRIAAYSNGTMADTAWDGDAGQPTYRGESTIFKVDSSSTTPETATAAPDVRCTLESIKVSVALEKNMAELSSNANLTARIFDPSKGLDSSPYALEFEEGADKAHRFGVVYLDEDNHTLLTDQGDGGYDVAPACGYFKPVVEQNAITLHVDMNYGGTHINQNVPICTNAKANEYRRIMLYITHGEEDDLGKIFINATVETWTYDEEVTVDVVQELLESFGEEAIPDIYDPNAPRITSPDFSFVDENRFDASSFSTAGDYLPSAKVAVETVSQVAAVKITLGTDNRMLQSIYTMHGTNGVTVDMMDDDETSAQARTYLATLGFPLKSDLTGKTKFELNLRRFFAQLFLYGGHHSVVITVVDRDGYSSTETLNLFYDSENGSAGEIDRTPSIVWPGKDMNNRYDVGPDGLKVDINISAPLGIEHLYVKMSGKIEAGLAGMMPTEFDLTDPEQAQEGLSDTLRELKFPVGDEVKGETALLFDISGFMTMLSVFPGESDFELTVVDAENQQVTSTIKLNVLENN